MLQLCCIFRLVLSLENYENRNFQPQVLLSVLPKNHTAVCFAACFTMKHATACFARFFNICFLRKSPAACFVFSSPLVYIFLSNKSKINAKKRCRVLKGTDGYFSSCSRLCVSLHFNLKQNVKINRSSYHSNFEN